MATIKQKRAFKELAVNGGNITAAMRSAGYAESITNDTRKLTNSKGFQELLNEYLPDELLTNVHLQGLRATRIHTSHTEPDKEIPDFGVRHKYLETAYKVKGKIKDESSGDTKIMIVRLNV
jgi:hypothetical protein